MQYLLSNSGCKNISDMIVAGKFDEMGIGDIKSTNSFEQDFC